MFKGILSGLTISSFLYSEFSCRSNFYVTPNGNDKLNKM